jgi:hypothetical protein
MLKHVRSHLTYANVMATLCLFLLLGGGAWAAFKLPKNSVGTKQLKAKAVTPAKVSPKTIARFRGARGPAGQTGQTGQTGPSDAYINSIDTIQALSGVATNNQVAALSLPAGSYALNAKLLADNDNPGGSRIDCTLAGPTGNQLDFMKLNLEPTSSGQSEFGNISLAGATTLSAPGTVSVQCQQLGAATPGITVGFRKLVAIKVGALHP